MDKITTNRVDEEHNKHLREEHTGFREGRGTTEKVFTLRNTIELRVEWNSNLYMFH